MIIWILLGLMLFYLTGFVIAYGLTFADFQGRFPNSAESMYKRDRRFGLFMGLFSWIGVYVSLKKGEGEHGFKLW